MNMVLYPHCLRVICAVLACAASNLAAAQTADSAGTQVRLVRSAMGTYYLSGEIGAAGRTDLLVDTGSSYLVVGQALFEKLQTAGEASFSHDLNALMANGTYAKVPVYRVSYIKLGEACWVHDVEVAVFSAAARPILGMNVLAQLAPFTLTMDPPGLSLHRCLTAPPASKQQSSEAADQTIAAKEDPAASP